MTSLRRALLFMPGDNLHKIEKGSALGVDSVIMDLEDAVTVNQKPTARETVVKALQTLNFGQTERLIRINALSTPFYQDDLAVTAGAHPDGYVIPKVESAEQIHTVTGLLDSVESRHGWTPIPLLVIIETGMEIINLREIVTASLRITALMFGAEDFTSSIGAIRTRGSVEVLYARSAVVTYAKSFGLGAIDTPFVDLQDEAELIRDTTQAMQMGYTGKQAIHPKQIGPITQVFNPTPDAIAQAQRVVEANTMQASSGTGAFALDGKLIDAPMVRAAENVIRRAQAAGLI